MLSMSHLSPSWSTSSILISVLTCTSFSLDSYHSQCFVFLFYPLLLYFSPQSFSIPAFHIPSLLVFVPSFSVVTILSCFIPHHPTKHLLVSFSLPFHSYSYITFPNPPLLVWSLLLHFLLSFFLLPSSHPSFYPWSLRYFLAIFLSSSLTFPHLRSLPEHSPGVAHVHQPRGTCWWPSIRPSISIRPLVRTAPPPSKWVRGWCCSCRHGWGWWWWWWW